MAWFSVQVAETYESNFRSLGFLKLTRKVAIVSINVCDIRLSFIWHLLLLVMPATPKMSEINFMLDLHWFGKVWTGS